jgi:hypothetical protein
MDDPRTMEARALMKASLQSGVKTTPLCQAIMGWLCGAVTEPSVAQMRRSADGIVWLRLSDEAALAPLCSYREFLDQLRIICASLHMTEEQERQIAGWAQMRLF